MRTLTKHLPRTSPWPDTLPVFFPLVLTQPFRARTQTQRGREASLLVQGHTGSQWQNWDQFLGPPDVEGSTLSNNLLLPLCSPPWGDVNPAQGGGEALESARNTEVASCVGSGLFPLQVTEA